MAPSVVVLFEHASGYALFQLKEFEELGNIIPQVEESINDLSKFQSIVKLVAFSPFKSGPNALDNMNSISEGIIHDDLRTFLDNNLPKLKKGKLIVGVCDRKLADALSEEMDLSVQHSGAIPEVLRGIRAHFHNLIKGLTLTSSGKAQLGLGHSYSRAKVKFNVHRVDNMIIQSIALLDQIDKDLNLFSMRLREWYSYHFPELYKIIPDNLMFAKAVQYIKNRKELTEDKLEGLEEIVMDTSLVQAIFAASKSSMGMDISPVDLINIERFCSRVLSLSTYRQSLFEYLKSRMGAVAPNLATLIGEMVGARLISHAGSLTNLAKYPASTVQILGAEKALFRALKTRGNTPKYGLLFHSSYIGRAGITNRGRISRYIANKCSIAARIDCFSDVQATVFGEKLKEQVEDRLKFYASGDIPAKNIDVMHEAMEELSKVAPKTPTQNGVSSERKKKKKSKKGKNDEEAMDVSVTETPKSEKKKKKKKGLNETVEETPKSERKRKASVNSTVEDTPKSEKKKKKKESLNSTMEETPKSEKKKKKKRSATDLDTTQEDTPVVKKKKKKSKSNE